MIELPDDTAPNDVQVEPVDYGMTLEPSGGASLLRVNRAGSRLRLRVSYPPMKADVARRFCVRLQVAKREGLRIEYPLLGVSQGVPGSPVVNGANPSGTTLPLRGLTPGYTLKEGYVLTLIDSNGDRYTHFSATTAQADPSGVLSITVEPPIRGVFADGDEVLLAKPTFEGALIESVGWSLSVDRLVRLGAEIVIQESAGLSADLVT